ncbi:hypothetical protein H0H92_006029 [Tricholoma furcatifolium]|nr:hypothetical protein H0H92_006029 [Tricholoma furcatifolium]
MFTSLSLLGFVLSLLADVHAGPLDLGLSLERRATVLSSSQLQSLAPFTQFARAAYCEPTNIQGWKCGGACDALPGFEPTLTGGDGDAVQFYFVGFWPQGNTVVVAHQGTDPMELQSDLTDIEITREPLDPTLFPGVPSSVTVHSGFRNEHALTSKTITAEVKRLLTAKKANQVTTIGHSLGGALAMLSALSLRLQLPATVKVSSTTFGTPRVGDQAFANFFDLKVKDFKRVNNEHDLVPILPGRFLGFVHPSGEIHLLSETKAVACAGQDNELDPECTNETVPTILEGSLLDHLGPYEDDIYVGTLFCN